jgi:hypothetical protein
MSFASAFTQLSLPLLPAASLLRGAFLLALLLSVLLFFRPLLSGIVRALLLLLRPRPARAPRPASGSLGSGA